MKQLMIVISLLAWATASVHAEAFVLDDLLAQVKNKADVKALVNPSGELVFPQVANGTASGLRIKTQLILTSTDLVGPVDVTITFRDGAGRLFPVALRDINSGRNLGTQAQFNLSIPQFVSVFLETDGLGTLQEGSAVVESTEGQNTLGGTASFSLFDNASGRFTSIVGIGGSERGTIAFYIPVQYDVNTGTRTALAMANPTTSTIHMCLLAISSGQAGGGFQETFTLAPLNQTAEFVDEILPLPSRWTGTLYTFRVDRPSCDDLENDIVALFDLHALALLSSGPLLTSIPIINVVNVVGNGGGAGDEPAPEPDEPENPDDPYEVGIESRITEKNSVFWRFAWKLSIKNNRNTASSFDAEIQFLDEEGFVIDTEREFDLQVRPKEEKVFTGDTLIGADVAPNVKSVKAIVAPR